MLIAFNPAAAAFSTISSGEKSPSEHLVCICKSGTDTGCISEDADGRMPMAEMRCELYEVQREAKPTKDRQRMSRVVGVGASDDSDEGPTNDVHRRNKG